MTLFQRIRTPFSEVADDDSGQPPTRAHAVGELLREHRQELGIELEAIGEALRIKPVYLAAIEQGRPEELPGPTYAIGFIRAYANYLGLDGERVLDSYKAESAEVHTRPDLALPVPLGERSVPGGRILLVGLILALVGYGGWHYFAGGERSRPERVAAVPAELQQLTAQSPSAQGLTPAPSSATATAAAKPAPAAPTRVGVGTAPQFSSGLFPSQPAAPGPAETVGPPPGAEPAGGPVQAASGVSPGSGNAASAAGGPSGSPTERPSGSIDIRALADAWIQIRAADQSIVFARVLKAGETYRVPRPGLILRTGNAGALEILVDGKPAPSIGGVGTLRRNIALEPDALRGGTAVRG